MTDYLPQASSTGHGHEANTLTVKGLIVFAVILVGVGILVEFSLVFIMKDFKQEETALEALAPPGLADKSATFPAPRLQKEPPIDLTNFKQSELHRLNEYGWVDRKAGIAHIPIARAIDIVAATGLPPTDGPAEKKADAIPAATTGGPDARQDGKP